MRYFVVLVFLCLGYGTFSQLQVVSGACVDSVGAPMTGVFVQLRNNPSVSVFTDENGRYQLEARNGDTLYLVYKSELSVYRPEQVFIVEPSKTKIPTITFRVKVQRIEGVNIVQKVEKPFDIEALELKNLRLIPVQNVEQVLKYTTAASSNNELTSNYNVRGGSYDENLVYINGFQVYRPFLTRAGQQEGMSIINGALVQSLAFSAGGFDAKYGDKLSSVLDITYREADTLGASLLASFLGIEAHVEQRLGNRFSYQLAGRYRSNGYFLNSLPTKGAYNPVFADGQLLTDYKLNENWSWSTLTHFSSNDYRFIPQTSETDFGTANEAYSFNVYYEGQERTDFTTVTAGSKWAYDAGRKTKLAFFATYFHSNEKEYFDVLGQYFINRLETDPSKEEFGDSVEVLGVGSYLEHARNKLKANIYSVYHTGSYELFKGFGEKNKEVFRKSDILWGANLEYDDFKDRLSEWVYIDSAGFSLPQGDDEILLNDVVKGNLALQTFRASAYSQWQSTWSKGKKNFPVKLVKTVKIPGQPKVKTTILDTVQNATAKWAVALGGRVGYTEMNNEFYFTPRASITYFPRSYMLRDSNIVKRNSAIRFQTGLYYQPPFYRDLRTFDGQLRTSVLAQKSLHIVAGYDRYFQMWGRKVPFKLTMEGYYKYLWDVNPFEVENVRTRYYAMNDARAYAYGADFNVHGEFVEGIESFFKIGFLSTKEDLFYDQYTEYYNASGETIIFGFSEDQTVVDSAVIQPGYIPRPTDQWVNIGALVQDEMPTIPAWTVQMGLNYGSPLPYGPPDSERFRDTLRLKAYFRVDLGTSLDFLQLQPKKRSFWHNNFSQAILSFEIYNLLGINNVLSKQWIQDVNGKLYAVPNYLTQRRFNLKMILQL